MGANQSKQDVLNKTMNDVVVNVLVSSSTSITSDITQSNIGNITSTDSSVTATNIYQSNAANINLQVLSESTNTVALQAELISKLKSAVDQTIPTLAIGSTTDQNITNIITNKVQQNFTNNNFKSIAAATKSTNVLNISGKGSVTLDNISQSNSATSILKLVDSVSVDIINNIKADNSIDSSALSKPASILPDLGSMLIIIIIIVICGGGYFLYTSTSAGAAILTNPAVLAIIAGVLVFLGYEAYASSQPTKK